jgi:twinkle protein
MQNPKCGIILDYLLNERKLTMETLSFYKVGVSFESFKANSYEYINLPCVTYPMFYPNNQNNLLAIDKNSIDKSIYEFYQCDKFYLAKLKIRSIGKEFKHFQRIEPTSALISGLFGLHTVPDNAEEIIITEGEYDAMAAYQVYI